MSANPPIVQKKNSRTGLWVKIDTANGKILDNSRRPFKGIPVDEKRRRRKSKHVNI